MMEVFLKYRRVLVMFAQAWIILTTTRSAVPEKRDRSDSVRMMAKERS